MIFEYLNNYLADFTNENEDFQYVHITINTKYQEFASSLFLSHMKIDVVYNPNGESYRDSIFSTSQTSIKAKFKGIRAYNLINYLGPAIQTERDYVHQESLVRLGTNFMPKLASSIISNLKVQSDSRFVYATNEVYPKNAIHTFLLKPDEELRVVSYDGVNHDEAMESAKYKFHRTVRNSLVRFTNARGFGSSMFYYHMDDFIKTAIVYDLYKVRLHPMEVKEYDYSVEPTKVYKEDDKGFNHLNIPNIAEGFYYRSRTYLDLSDFETDYVARCVVTNRMLIHGIGSTHESFPSLTQNINYGIVDTVQEVLGIDPTKAYISGYVNTVLKIAERNSRIQCSQCGDGVNNGYASGLMYQNLINAGETYIADFFKDVFDKIRSDFLENNNDNNLCYRCEAEQRQYSEFLVDGSFVRGCDGFYYVNPVEGIEEPPYDEYLFGVQDWSFKPTNYNFVTSPDDDFEDGRTLYMGVELEFDDGGESYKSAAIALGYLTKNNPFAYAMHDGSLDNGIEIATMPATLKAHMNPQRFDYEAMSKALRSMQYTSQSNDRCGMHVHVNRSFFGESSKKQMLSAALMALIIESNWEDVVKFSRRDYYSIDRWAGKKKLKERRSHNEESVVDDFIDEYDDRYVALNINPNKTFEFRIFNSSLNRKVILATLQFVSNLAHMVKGMSLNQAQNVTFGDVVSYHHYDELNDLCLNYNLPTE